MAVASGNFGLLTQDASGKWVNAVTKNAGGTAKFVQGSWNPIYQLGTYGVDATTNRAWAVLNYSGNFAVGQP